MPPITDVVKNLIIINVLMYFGTSFALPAKGIPLFALFYPTSEYFKPLQLVTHMFMHGSTMHILFNMYAVFLFGSALESYWGAKRFLKFYFICGFGAMALYMLVRHYEISGLPPELYIQAINIPMLGASGAVFGLLAGFGTVFPNTQLSLIFPPISMKAKYFVMIYAALELYLGVSGFQTGIAHFAHLGGALFGYLLVIYWQRGGNLI